MVRIPPFLYGTAWKQERTQRCVVVALRAGFAGIDTANQPRHYHEAGVGTGLAAYLAESGSARERVFLQTKFTHRDGQDHRVPYDPGAPVATQVEQSFASSLEHLQTDHIDCYVLHGPSSPVTLTDEDWQAWHAMERIAKSGRASILGVSNVSAAHIELLLAHAELPPAVVQNRCYARRGWDREVRALCAQNGILYQGFSLLTANPHVVSHPSVRRIAERVGRTPEQVLFRFALAVGIVPLIGTTSELHMKQDLACNEIDLYSDDVKLIGTMLAA